MPPQATTPLSYAGKRGAICVADGYRVTVRVRRGRLLVEDGFGSERRMREYSRVASPIARLLVMGGGGSISLEAFLWLRDIGAVLVHLSRDGRLVATTAPEAADARLRRAQALAGHTRTGLEVARSLLRTKLDGQADVLATLHVSRSALESFGEASSALDEAACVNELMQAERDAALAYWGAWSKVEIRFRLQDRDRVPIQWTTFGQRTSPLTSSPRVAVNPANAILNYLYALLEAEARIAALAVGLDPGVGIIHSDVRGRDSLALDLMEAGRAAVDRYVLELLRHRVFRASDFVETRRGDCRIRPPLSQDLSETTSLWRGLLGPVTEGLARTLADVTETRIERLSTPLSSSNRRAANAHRRRRRARDGVEPRRLCRACGQPVPNSDRTYCDMCAALPQEQRYAISFRLGERTTAEGKSASTVERTAAIRTSKRCKRCGEPVTHRKRALCDSCFVEFRRELTAQRRSCKRCGEPVPHRKRVYCDPCLGRAGRPEQLEARR